MFIHLDPRRPDVLVPRGFMGQPQLVLQVGLNMAIPIPDLKIDDACISCTLSFNRVPFWCRIPWSAVYALIDENGRGGVWADDVPAEIQQQKPGSAPPKAAGKKPRPRLTVAGAAEKPRPASAPPAALGPRRGLSAVPSIGQAWRATTTTTASSRTSPRRARRRPRPAVTPGDRPPTRGRAGASRPARRSRSARSRPTSAGSSRRAASPPR